MTTTTLGEHQHQQGASAERGQWLRELEGDGGVVGGDGSGG